MKGSEFEPKLYRENKTKKGKENEVEKENEIKRLDLAYAITIHRSQGKGYDTVVIIIHSTAKKMLNKNLLYTAITRAKKKCIIIGDKEGLEACKKEMPIRITNLCKNNMIRLNEEIPSKDEEITII